MAVVNGSIEALWQEACTITRLVASSVCVSEAAGKLIKDILRTGKLNTINKSNDGKTMDYQTEADRLAQYCIEKSLQQKFGNRLKIIGEEETTSSVQFLESKVSSDVLKIDSKCTGEIRTIKEEDVVIWVDPLDGTSEFVETSEEDSPFLHQVTVLIGITHKGRPVAGVIHQPFCTLNGRTIWGIKGAGVFGLDIAQQPSGEKIAVTTKSHFTPQIQTSLDTLISKGLISKFERVGGAGFKVLRCLEGAAAYVFPSGGCKKWDTAAPEAVLISAGGKLTDVNGEEIDYSKTSECRNSTGVIASAPWVDHKELIDAIPFEVKQSL